MKSFLHGAPIVSGPEIVENFREVGQQRRTALHLA